MKWIKWFFSLFKDYDWKEDWELVYFQTASWLVNETDALGWNPPLKYNTYCRYEIWKKESNYKLTYSGYKPLEHNYFSSFIFPSFRALQEGTAYIKENKIYKQTNNNESV